MKARTKMKKRIAIWLSVIMALSLVACSSTDNSSVAAPESSDNSIVVPPSSTSPADEKINSNDSGEDTMKVLVAYFSRAGENYGVGVIEKGNTCIIAEMIAEQVGGELFEIKRVKPYPESYNECTEEAKQEQSDNVRPELTATVENFDDYDVIFLGYPNWWGDMPMPVYTFLESYDFAGKTIIPFCTHAGSGLSSTESSIAGKCPEATVLAGLAMAGTTAQNDQENAKPAVIEWLDTLEY